MGSFHSAKGPCSADRNVLYSDAVLLGPPSRCPNWHSRPRRKLPRPGRPLPLQASSSYLGNVGLSPSGEDFPWLKSIPSTRAIAAKWKLPCASESILPQQCCVSVPISLI